jgi:hypothetical protein
MHRSQLLAFAALALLLTAGLAAFALRAGVSLSTQEELDYGEGIVLWQATHVTNWKKAFHPLENYPHIVFHYPPVYHLTARLMAAATGDLLTAGRLTSILSLTASCLVTALLTAMCLPSGGSLAARWLGSFSAGTLIFTTPVWTWTYLMRVDTLAIFLSFTGLALFVLARRRPALAFLSFACFVAAIYTKQTMVAAPAACLLLAFVEKPRFSVFLLAFAVSAGVVVLVVLQTLTDGLFLRHIIGYNLNPFALGRLFRFWIDNASRSTALLSVAAMFPVALFCRRSGSVPGLVQRVRLALGRSAFERCITVAAVHFWLAAATTVAAGKQGAYLNYFLEFDLSASLISGLFLGWLVRRVSFRPQGSYGLLALLIIPLFLLQAASNIITFRDAIRTFSQPAPNHSEEVVRFLQELPEPVYSENMTILMQAGKEIPAEPAIITALAKSGRWDESSFVSRIEHGQFQAIVVNWKETSLSDRERFSESVARAVHQRYSLSKSFGPFGVYLPK